MSSGPFPRRLLVAVASVVALAATGCGSDQRERERSDAASQTPTVSSSPSADACASVWTEGATLPRGYDGCDDGGSFVAKDVLPCSSGQRMVRFDDHYYAVLGGTIHQTESVLDEDVGYRDAVASCRG